MKPFLFLAMVGACAGVALALASEKKDPEPPPPGGPPLPFPPPPSRIPEPPLPTTPIPNVGIEPFEKGAVYTFSIASANGSIADLAVLLDSEGFDDVGFTEVIGEASRPPFLFKVKATWRGVPPTILANDLATGKVVITSVPRKIV